MELINLLNKIAEIAKRENRTVASQLLAMIAVYDAVSLAAIKGSVITAKEEKRERKVRKDKGMKRSTEFGQRVRKGISIAKARKQLGEMDKHMTNGQLHS